MTNLAFSMLRRRPGSVVATLLALAVGVMILTTMGMLVESGLRYRPETQRYAAAAIVVADRDITFTGKEFGGDPYKTTVTLPDGGTVPAELVDQIRQVPGVVAAVPDHSIPVQAQAFGAALGRGWSSAALTPYRLTGGTQPSKAGDIVLDRRLAGTALRVGQSVELTIAGTAHRFRVSGFAEQTTGNGQPAAAFFTDSQAAAFAPHPGRVDAIGVITAPDADQPAVAAAVGRLAEPASAKAYTGDDRAKAEESGAAGQASDLLIQVGAAFGGYIVLLIICVVAGTVGLSVRHRRRDLALLRAIGAKPGQVRRMLMAEAALTGAAAAVMGVPAGLLTTRWAVGELTSRGFVPAGFPMANGALAALAAVIVTTVFAVLATLIAARRITAIRPTEALGESAVESAGNSKIRLGFGLVTLVGALSSSVATVSLGGQTALAAAIGMLYLFVIAVGLLAPWINRFAARLLAPVLQRFWGTSGFLATANLKANAQGMATVLTALVLSVGFGGSVWFLQDNLERATLDQSRDGMLAQHVLTAPAGLPADAVGELRGVPGVEAVTGVRRTSVIVRIMDGAEVVSARAIDPGDAASTMDLKVENGNLSDLRGDSIAVSGLRASSQGWKVGEQAEVWLGDGTAKKLRVAAIYQRGLGFGDVILSRETVGAGLDEVLIRTAPGADADAALAKVAARYPSSTLLAAGDVTGALATDLALSAWLNKLLIGVMVGYAALAAANTMVMAALARRRELALLRLSGVTRRQVKRMIHAEQAGLLGVALAIGATIAAVTLVAVVATLTGDPVPYIPPLGWAAVLGGASLLAMTTTILPISKLLRTPPIENLATKE
ncbi:ABC transporter permease [Kribbella sp. CA-293567]|uniref:ABC transporter permease n=1 Tax=Kribbella sp. CA-293567 TaxID=3002436 RepID=UPI0022DE15ED|nr:FtsX-like permease family protein [Kribbella sp. CA-293567]WBQ02627.1 ABC transporter permease [Kribbella sp. CA-293567]